MKEKWIISSKNLVILLIIIGLFCSYYNCKKTPTTPDLPSYGSIQVNSTPTGATIWLDGLNTGKSTNALLTNVSVGSHTIKLTRNYYQDFETIVTVEKHQTAIVNAELELVTIPTLISPENGAVLDNGCTGYQDLKTWDFDWSDVIGAIKYHLYVKHTGSLYPAINKAVYESSYRDENYGYVINSNRFNWRWKVRAFIDDRWYSWSEEGYFVVEALNTDCPSN